ncbi:hypothetical protein Hanom_Chr11g00972941 [Helianthus anomalus]
MELNWKKSTGTSSRYAAHEMVSSATRLRKLNEVGPEIHPAIRGGIHVSYRESRLDVPRRKGF